MLALVGVQLATVMVSVSGTLPVFLMYTVCVAVSPGLRAPTFRSVTVWVHSLSEYTPRLIAFIVPFSGTVWFVLRTAAVVSVRASAVATNAITAMVDIFFSSIFRSLTLSRVVSINKH